VVTFDGPGNGRSDRPDPRLYTPEAITAAALAVLDATGTDRAITVSLSKAATWVLKLTADHPSRILGSVFIGPTVPLTPQYEDRQGIRETFDRELDDPQGWEKYNAAYWQDHWEEFAEFFFGSASASRTRPSSARTRLVGAGDHSAGAPGGCGAHPPGP
jgi:pimeloyl-ACP methyl ester carboxylesterase